MTYNNSYEDSSIFTEKTMSDSCNGSKCIVSCSCNSANGWYDTPSSYSARAASAYGSVTKTSSRTYADLGNKTKSCTHNCSCSTSSSTSCPTGYSTGTTSCASGQYFVSTSCTTTTTYACSPSGCSYNNTYTYPKGGKCNNCTYYKSNETCPQGYTLGKTSCDAGYSLTQTSSTITNTRNYGSATECPTYTSSAANRCGKCTRSCDYYSVEEVKNNDSRYKANPTWYDIFKDAKGCYNAVLMTCSKYFGCQEIANAGCTLDQTEVWQNAPWGGERCCPRCISNNPSGSKCADSGYYDGTSCSAFHQYGTSMGCQAEYNDMGLRCGPTINSCSTNNKECLGACDVDSWNRCCIMCNGGI